MIVMMHDSKRINFQLSILYKDFMNIFFIRKEEDYKIIRNLGNLGNLGNLRKEEDYKQFINIIHFYGLHLSNANF